MTAKVCDALKLGVSFATAAAHAGVSPSAVAEWRRKGASGEQPFAYFREATDAARAQCEVRLAAIMMKAAQEGDVAAAKWLSEHRSFDSGDDDGAGRPTAAAILAKMAGG